MDTNDEKVDGVINSMLYVLESLDNQCDFHKLFKILYFAEQKHLVRYGASISEDVFIKMDNGPVPSLAYDIMKSLRSGKNTYQGYFDVESVYYVVNKVKPDMEWLSETEVICLDESIDENKSMDFGKLTEKSHDIAWKGAKLGRSIDPVLIAEAGGASKEMLDYIEDLLSFRFAEFE
ncbi:uncharacterized protein DUF4065 [Dyadobacter jejuensis]|uniref:Uncharacterized protein DUF4065 n=1 Tax=Dyadobacter jejuensis TaxID=1082580 RepID=A0A316BA95_9BACT|nr:Panacea domain-containing protein [Dyadobacter jejuensis]PWJ59467.1 uncharacterized protein DUF4065 [Dyadobacter jejuensis]